MRASEIITLVVLPIVFTFRLVSVLLMKLATSWTLFLFCLA